MTVLSDEKTRKEYDASGYQENIAQGNKRGGENFNFNFEEFNLDELFSHFFGKDQRERRGQYSSQGFTRGSRPGAGGGGGGEGGGGGQNPFQQQEHHGRSHEGMHHTPSKPKTHVVKVNLEDLLEDSTKTVQVNGKSFDIKIPKGCPDGVVLKKNGEEFRVVVNPHPLYGRGGLKSGQSHGHDKKSKGLSSDIFYTADVYLHETLLGCDVEIPTIDGGVETIHLDQVTPQSTYKLKGQGLPRYKQNSRGHMLIDFRIVFPSNTLSSNHTQLIEEMSKEWKYPSKSRRRHKGQNKHKNLVVTRRNNFVIQMCWKHFYAWLSSTVCVSNQKRANVFFLAFVCFELLVTF
ncbi:DNAj like protein [Reticulomyxa filosa]|uniref:DNAj like protein n=1 Tax=Reticulomyxa filosa TaxID=46433 RepID=X6MM65_RETFI|nr:DNAj like protein [Reticulomyxa filosa]|eukprot:ETO14180.1 DNAj like protein [Reticulomyxa filosa]